MSARKDRTLPFKFNLFRRATTAAGTSRWRQVPPSTSHSTVAIPAIRASRESPFSTVRFALLALVEHPRASWLFSKQLPLPRRFLQPFTLVQDALHELLLLLAIGEDFADGLGDQP